MKPADRLVLSARKGIISFFFNGVCLRVYQQSLFSYITLTKRNVKIWHLSQHPDECPDVVYGSIIRSHAAVYFGQNLRWTNWGAEVSFDWDAAKYDEWYNHILTCNNTFQHMNIKGRISI